MNNNDPFIAVGETIKNTANNVIDAVQSPNTSSLKSNLADTGGYVKQAASEASSAIRAAASAASAELKSGSESVKSTLADGAVSGRAAAADATAAAREQADAMLEKGKEFVDVAANYIKERPLAAFGAAFAAGFLLSKLGGGGRNRED